MSDQPEPQLCRPFTSKDEGIRAITQVWSAKGKPMIEFSETEDDHGVVHCGDYREDGHVCQ